MMPMKDEDYLIQAWREITIDDYCHIQRVFEITDHNVYRFFRTHYLQCMAALAVRRQGEDNEKTK